MSARLVIFTDLDGTLLDRKTYQPGPAAGSLQRCHSLNIPVVLVSGKSRAEMEKIRQQLQINGPFISENGGGLFIPVDQFSSVRNAVRDGSYWCIRSEEKVGDKRRVLLKIAAKIGVEVRCFDSLTVEEVSEMTGLSLEQASLAKRREFDEPFLIVEETAQKLERLRNEIVRQGHGYTCGGFFHHITGNFDKGQRVQQLKDLYLERNPQIKFAAVGDAVNDLPMLKEADYPFLVRRQDNTYDENVVFEGLVVTDGIGPQGFAEAVESLIATLGLAT